MYFALVLKSGLELITFNGDLSNARFQNFILQLTLEDLYIETDVKPGITHANTTAGRQLLNSIDREFPIIHSLLEIENTNAISVLHILIELFKKVDIIELKLDVQYKMHNSLDITDEKCIQDSTLLPVKKKFQFYYWFAFNSNINFIDFPVNSKTFFYVETVVIWTGRTGKEKVSCFNVQKTLLSSRDFHRKNTGKSI